MQLLVPPKEVDLMGEEAMANAYNISHNVQVQCLLRKTQNLKRLNFIISSKGFLNQDFMYFRGLRWPGMPKKSKKKKKR